MNTPSHQTGSDAFRLAALRSERRRIVGIIGLLATLAGVIIVRALLSWAGLTPEWSVVGDPELAVMGLTLLAIGILHESLMLGVVGRAIRVERVAPGWLWPVNIVAETALPTAALLIMCHTELTYGYKALVAPTVYVYYLFIILSSLRLDPRLCLMTGAVSAVSYAAVVVYVHWRFPGEDQAAALPGSIYVTVVIMMMVGGGAAAFVTREVSTHVAAALREAEARSRAEQLEHDLDIARSIQQGLLPTGAPELDGYDIAAWNRPADQTGGDYYDWQALPGGRLAVSLADVTGHGIGPALVAAVCRAYARASMPAAAELERAMTRVNELLVEDLPDNRFVTFVVAVLDAGSPQLQLLSAGHGPLYLYRAEKDAVESFTAQDIPLGIAPGRSFGPVTKIDMDPGDALVLLTDGFFEWADRAGQMFGTQRLAQAIKHAKDKSADGMIRHLKETVETFSDGTPQADDLTVVVVKRRPD